ncbi:3-hydroxybutyryl-CoA dehydrogenase [Nonomuraea jabiensis]|uniref:3-hydroxybutyryl-CoA dehydrogenase n=1 Tax=Nonomuraea jabiensis TaxID=882448 RepID=A0A7W9G8M6_9ACTN|nr:3-hydroxybutyryl-CoA dehydrogenase [Nonomuraea jabiensis]MBB5779168.1 3-hydroxybutyryl-CoA dehydrogenase [Nonomuraea jabiensis]
MSEMRKVGIVGSGVMGSGIAEACARAGLDVIVAVSTEASLAPARRRVTEWLDRGLRRATITEAERDAALARVSFVTDLAELGDRQIVFEAVPESESIKLDVLGALDKILDDPDAILASNTSSIPIIRLARATSRPAQVIGVHFFNPVPALPLVELIGSLLTADETYARAESFVAGTLGKQVIRSQDRAGFVVNALLIPFLLSAVRMVESGFARADVVDRGMVLGCSHPMGPLKLADLIGLDTVASIAEALYEEFKEPLYTPPPLLLRMVEGGLLGKKTGRGFYEYA